MAHIVEFEIEGLAGRSKTYSRKLNRHINIFFGVNGGGKTSLLKILHSALSQDASILEKVPFRFACVKIFSEDNQKTFTYEISKSNSQTNDTNPRQQRALPSSRVDYLIDSGFESIIKRRLSSLEWKRTDSQPMNVASLRWRHNYLPTNRLVLGLQQANATSLTEEFLDKIFKDATERFWLNLFGRIQAQVRKVQQDGIAAILNQALGGEAIASEEIELNESLAYERMMTFLQRQYPRARKIARAQFSKKFRHESLIRSIVSRIDQVESAIERAMAPKDKLQTLLRKLFNENKTIQLNETAVEIITVDNQKIDIGSLSSGEKHLLRILLEVIAAEGTPLIVDEPEISMHIDWQRELIGAMRELNPEAQLILATHSPEVMANIDDQHIFPL